MTLKCILLQIQIQTTSLNRSHDLISSTLRRRDRANLRRALSSFYNVGITAAVFGTLGAIGMLAWTCVGLAYVALSPAQLSNLSLTKRDIHEPAPPHSVLVKPIVSGFCFSQLGHIQFVYTARFPG